MRLRRRKRLRKRAREIANLKSAMNTADHQLADRVGLLERQVSGLHAATRRLASQVEGEE